MISYREEDYRKDVYRTLSSTDKDNIAHAIIGITTEAGELLDAYKKHRFYGRALDTKNLKEEIGDIMWYLTVLNGELGYSFQDAMTDNIAKLKKRYPEKFEDIVDRDVEDELSHIKDNL